MEKNIIGKATFTPLVQEETKDLTTSIEARKKFEAYVASHVAELFRGAQIVRQNAMLPGGNVIDFHLRTDKGQDIFVEIKQTRIEKEYLIQLVEYYTAILNMEPAPKSFKIVIIAASIDPSLRNELKHLKTMFMPLRKLAFPKTGEPLQHVMLSPVEARLIVALESRKSKLVRPRDVAKLLNCDMDYATVLLHRLERKKWVDRIANGKYTFIPAAAGYGERFPSLNPLLAGSSLVHRYYFSYSTANAHYGLSTQLPSVVYISILAKRPMFVWRNTRFKFVTLGRRKFFGFTKAHVQNAEVNMAELEKAIIDSVDKPKYVGGIEEVLRVMWRGYPRADKSKLVDYASRMKTSAVCQRLGFLLDFLAGKRLIEEIPERLKRRLLEGVGTATVYIGPRGFGGNYSRDWRVIKTISDEQLMSEISIK